MLEQGEWLKLEAQLPKLKTLSFEDYHRANFLELFARAPNLKEVQSSCPLNWIESVPLEKMHIIRNVVLFEIAKIGLLWQKFLQSEPKLHTLTLRGRGFRSSATKEEYLNGLLTVLHSSCDSLRRLKIDCECMYDAGIIAERMPVLKNVTELVFISTTWGQRSAPQFRLGPIEFFPALPLSRSGLCLLWGVLK